MNFQSFPRAKRDPKALQLPYKWKPRSYQRPLWNYLWKGGKRAICVWHRRAGKDDIALHWAMVSAWARPGTYWHMLPEFEQGRKAIWNAVDESTGLRRIDQAFPTKLRRRSNDNSMFIEFVNGATWQVVGSDSYNKLVGSPPVGITISEWALARPGVWGYLSPILRNNGGWALFITTPRGENHAKQLLDLAQDDEEWFAQVLTVDDTRRLSVGAGEKAPMSDVDIEQERKAFRAIYGQDEGDALIEQEYFCSFNAAVIGSYYGSLMNEAEQEGRVCDFEIEPTSKVHTAWDIGHHDATAIWWFQLVGSKIMVLEYYEVNGKGAPHAASIIKSKPYKYAKDEHGIIAWLPHDARVTEWGTERSRVESLVEYGISPQIVPEIGLDDGHNSVRLVLPRCVFRKEQTRKGRKALREYQKEWDEKHLTFKPKPMRNWATHGADAFRYMAVSYKQMVPAPPPPPRKLLTVGPGNEATLDDLWPLKGRQISTRI